MTELYPYISMSSMLVNIGTALIGIIAGVRAVMNMHGRQRETYRLVYMGILACVTFIIVDLNLYYTEANMYISFLGEMALRSWLLLVVAYVTLTLAEQAKCSLQDSGCPKNSKCSGSLK